jgi:hypothetical protein
LTAVIVASAGLLLSGCGPLSSRSDSGCTPREEALSQRLVQSDVLQLAPMGAEHFENYVTKPCQDDDNVGMVGTRFDFPGTADAVRDYYRAELPGHGWVLMAENPPFVPGQAVDTGGPELCFENTAYTGVTLGIHTATPAAAEMSEELPARPSFLEFRFTEQGLNCTDS